MPSSFEFNIAQEEVPAPNTRETPPANEQMAALRKEVLEKIKLPIETSKEAYLEYVRFFASFTVRVLERAKAGDRSPEMERLESLHTIASIRFTAFSSDDYFKNDYVARNAFEGEVDEAFGSLVRPSDQEKELLESLQSREIALLSNEAPERAGAMIAKLTGEPYRYLTPIAETYAERAKAYEDVPLPPPPSPGKVAPENDPYKECASWKEIFAKQEEILYRAYGDTREALGDKDAYARIKYDAPLSLRIEKRLYLTSTDDLFSVLNNIRAHPDRELYETRIWEGIAQADFTQEQKEDFCNKYFSWAYDSSSPLMKQRFLAYVSQASQLSSEYFSILHREALLGKVLAERRNHQKIQEQEALDVIQWLMDTSAGEVFEATESLMGISPKISERLVYIFVSHSGSKGHEALFAKHLSRFSGLKEEVARRLIESGHTAEMMQNITSFSCDTDLAGLLLEKGLSQELASILPRFSGLSVRVAERLMQNGYSSKVAQNFTSFSCDHWMAQTCIQQGLSLELAGALQQFSHLGTSVATKLIDQDFAEQVAHNLPRFSDLNNDVSESLIQRGFVQEVGNALPQFSKLQDNVVQQLIEQGFLQNIGENLSVCRNLEAASAQALVQGGFAKEIGENLQNFRNLDRPTLEVLMQKGLIQDLAKRPSSFTGDAQLLLAEGIRALPNGVELLAARFSDYRVSVIDEEIAQRVVEQGLDFDLFCNVKEAFTLGAQNLVIERFLTDPAKVDELSTFNYLGEFKNLSSSIATRLAELRRFDILSRSKSSFERLDPALEARLNVYEFLTQKIDQSPSRTVRRMKSQLIEQLFLSPDPEKTYEKIEKMYLRNHLPLAGKIFLTFDTLYKDQHFEHKIYSPTLREAGARERKMLVYKDIINIHLDTGNPEMKAYLEGLRDMLPLLEKVEGHEELSAQESMRIEEFFRQIEILHDVSVHATIHAEDSAHKAVLSKEALQERLQEWKESLGTRKGQTIHERLEEMFLRPAGVGSIEEALARMEASKTRADTRNRDLIKASPERIVIQEGDLLKGVQTAHFLSYLQRGNVAGELLGYAATDDETRMDTDTGRVLAGDLGEGNLSALQKNPANAPQYGDGMVLLMRPTKERFLETRTTEEVSVHDQIRGKTAPYELFQSPVVDRERHFGVRTGFPFTEVSAIILKDPQRRQMLDLKMDLAANGYYVPIVDTEGKILFSPEEFDGLRQLYAGTEILPGEAYIVDHTVQNTDQAQAIDSLQERLSAERNIIEQTRVEIEKKVMEALKQVGIAIRTSGELATGAEIFNTGSTARLTSMPGETIDFDLALRLDEPDLEKQRRIEQTLDALLPGKSIKGTPDQWRRSGIVIQGNPVDIDVTFAHKPEVEGVPSHEVVTQRLGALERQNPSDAMFVRANIVYAKKILKQGGIYKKLDGGLGGIGVENWILQHGGSFAKASEAFLAAALNTEGGVRSFVEFSERYSVIDSGVNLMQNDDTSSDARKMYRHDNFLYFLQKDGKGGFEKMVKVLQTASA